MKIQYFFIILAFFLSFILSDDENNNFSEPDLNNDINNSIIDEQNEIENIIQYSLMIEQLNDKIQEKDTQAAINLTIILFKNLFSGIQQCVDEYNKTNIMNFLNSLNYTFKQQTKLTKATNIVTLCSKIYEIYEETIKMLIGLNQKADSQVSSKLKTFFESIIGDYQGLKEAGLFDQLIFIDDVKIIQQQDQQQPQFEILFVEYEEFQEIMDQHFSLIQAINALFEGKSLDIVFDYYEDLDIDDGEENDKQIILNKFLTIYWNSVKEAIENLNKVKQGWKKLYYQTIMDIAFKLRDKCHYFDREGVITKFQRNSEEEKKYLPKIECEYKINDEL